MPSVYYFGSSCSPCIRHASTTRHSLDLRRLLHPHRNIPMSGMKHCLTWLCTPCCGTNLGRKLLYPCRCCQPAGNLTVGRQWACHPRATIPENVELCEGPLDIMQLLFVHIPLGGLKNFLLASFGMHTRCFPSQKRKEILAADHCACGPFLRQILILTTC